MSDAGEYADEVNPWEAPDGTRWLWFPQYGEWHGWEPGEDGLWLLAADEFAALYPKGPQVRFAVSVAEV